jgi:hypothetical protein
MGLVFRVGGMSRKALKSAAQFAYERHTGVSGDLVKPPFCEQTLIPHHCEYTVFLLMRASAKAPVTLVT